MTDFDPDTVRFPIFSKMHMLISKAICFSDEAQNYSITYMYDGENMTKKYIDTCYSKDYKKPFNYFGLQILSLECINGYVLIKTFSPAVKGIPDNWHEKAAEDLKKKIEGGYV